MLYSSLIFSLIVCILCVSDTQLRTQTWTRANLFPSLYFYLLWLGCGGRDGTLFWRWEAIWLKGLFAFTFSWPRPWWEGSRGEMPKKRAVSSLPLCSLWLVFPNSQMLAREGWSEGICASAVWYLLSCEKACFKCQIFQFFWHIISSHLPPPSFHPFHSCTWFTSLSFWFSLYLTCAFLLVGLHVNVPDPNPGGLGRRHGPDSCGCRSYVGSSGGHLLHPLPSVCYPGETLAVSLRLGNRSWNVLVLYVIYWRVFFSHPLLLLVSKSRFSAVNGKNYTWLFS